MKKINMLAIAALVVLALGTSGCVEVPGGYYGGGYGYPAYGAGYGYPVYGSAYGYPAYEGWGSPAWNYGYGRTWGWPYHHDWDHHHFERETWAVSGHPYAFGERGFRNGTFHNGGYVIARNHEFGGARFAGYGSGHAGGRGFAAARSTGHGHERH
jgi:hypothetical protein